MLAKKIQLHLPKIIHPKQTGFVTYVFDNNLFILAQGAMEWVVQNKHDLVLLLLDIEKAFDHIEHRFLLFKVLEKLLDFIISGLNGPS